MGDTRALRTGQAPDQPPISSGHEGAKVLVVGNEKGGAGKSTIATLIAIALQYRGARVAVIDLDLRQQSLGRFLEHRRRWLRGSRVSAPVPKEYILCDDLEALYRAPQKEAVGLFEEAIVLAMSEADIVVIDTPGADTAVSRSAHLQADILVTPMNDSFVDFDVLGQIDPASQIAKPNHYAKMVHDIRQSRAAYGRSLDWLVLRNRLSTLQSRNTERLELALQTLSEGIGFRLGPALKERVIYRELFPFGLTLADLAPSLRPAKIAVQREAVRREVEAIVDALELETHRFQPLENYTPVDIQIRAAS